MKTGVHIVLTSSLVLFFICLLCTGCAPHNPDSSAPIRYHLADTMETNVGPSFYFGSRLYRGTEIIDTVSAGFGFSQFGRDSVVYLKLHLFNDTDWNESHDSVRLVYHDGKPLGPYVFDGPNGVKTSLSSRLAYYSPFSNPIVASGELLYWGLRDAPGDTIQVYAMRYGLKSEATDSVFLYQDVIGTDDVEYFKQPLAKGNGYAFTTPAEQVLTLDQDFRKLP